MQIGLCLPHFGRPLETGRLLEVARRADTLGFDSIWVTDHVIVPKDVYIAYRRRCSIPSRSFRGWPASPSGSCSARA